MNTIEAITKRRSIRHFLDTPVESEKLIRIFEAASRTPSWANTQPWEVFGASGESLKKIKDGFAACYESKEKAASEIPRPEKWSQAARERTMQIHPDMVRDCGEAAESFGLLNQTLFNAPFVAYLCLDKLHGEWSLYDLGAYSQSLMLAAVDEGLGSIPAYTLVMYPQVIREALAIPEELKIAIGIAIGYVDEDHGINNFHSSRSAMADNVRLFV